jgi:hypothetical protein
VHLAGAGSIWTLGSTDSHGICLILDRIAGVCLILERLVFGLIFLMRTSHKLDRYRILGSKKMQGFLSRMQASRSPLAV